MTRRSIAPTVRPPSLGRREASSTAQVEEPSKASGRRRRDNTLLIEGRHIGKKFELIRPLGDGGMGKVWLAMHLGLRRRVALKVLHRQVHANQDLRRRFEREAVAIGRLSHPGIVDALDFGELEDGRNFLAMEYVEGETLAELVRRDGPIDWRTVVRFAAQVADALVCVHQHGVVHRDLKPDNLIVQGGLANGRVRILDLGLARLEGASGLSVISDRDVALGNASFSSPEQLRGDATDERADVYGLGAVMYHALSGRPPFGALSFAEVVLGQHRGEAPLLRSISGDPTRPEPLDALVMRMLSRDPAGRPPTAAAVRDALDAMLDSPIEPVRTVGWRTIAIGTALLAAGAAIGGAVVAALVG